VNRELLSLFEADQADRRGAPAPEAMAGVPEQDRARRARVEALIASRALTAPEDYFHAAMIFQHGERLEDYLQAHGLALKAAEVGHPQARWLAAAAYDRWLMRQDKPQKYGTQYVPEGDRWKLWDVDPATSDAERTEWGVPPLAVALRQAEQLSAPGTPTRLALGPVLADLEVPGLRVEVQDASWLESTRPPPSEPSLEPLGAGEGPIPGYLPQGLTPRRVGAAFGAAGPTGRLLITWRRCHAPASGDPILERVDVGHRAGVRIRVAGRASSHLVSRAGPEACWLVAGELPHDELVRVAASLPADCEGVAYVVVPLPG
jgi:hypothetical protein